MDGELQKELRELERRLVDQIASVRTDSADAVTALASQIAGIDTRIAAMSSNERDILRFERELAEVKTKNVQQDSQLNELSRWKAALEAKGEAEQAGTEFWKGIGGRVLGAVVIAVVLGAGGTLLAVSAMLRGGATP